MTQWHFSEEIDKSAWNEKLLLFQNNTFVQRYEWGEFKSPQGWSSCRAFCRNNNGDELALMQLLVKKLPFGLNFFWAPGGILWAPSVKSLRMQRDVLKALQTGLKKKFARYFGRFFFYSLHEAQSAYLLSASMKRPRIPLKSEFSILVDLRRTEEELLSDMSSKHRYYVKKGQEHPLEWQVSSERAALDEFNAMYRELKTLKDSSRITIPGEDLYRLQELFGEDMFIFRGLLHGEAVTSCVVFQFGTQSFFYLASTGAKGREIFASYAMMFELWKCLKSRGIQEFDLSGIDPTRDSVAGVDHFKRGFGGQIVEYLGEWETASSSTVGRLGNLAVKWRIRKL